MMRVMTDDVDDDADYALLDDDVDDVGCYTLYDDNHADDDDDGPG